MRMKPKLYPLLAMDSCPHCGKANPTLNRRGDCFTTSNHIGSNTRWWSVYICNSCGGVIIAMAPHANDNPLVNYVAQIYPDILVIDESIPPTPREYLRQARDCFHAPAASIMACASALDAMLKNKDYVDGTLYKRIDKAAKDRLITEEMAKWAHQIRLDANEQRHVDPDSALPTEDEAKLTFDFTIAFAQYLFVLPAKVSRGIRNSEPKE